LARQAFQPPSAKGLAAALGPGERLAVAAGFGEELRDLEERVRAREVAALDRDERAGVAFMARERFHDVRDEVAPGFRLAARAGLERRYFAPRLLGESGVAGDAFFPEKRRVVLEIEEDPLVEHLQLEELRAERLALLSGGAAGLEVQAGDLPQRVAESAGRVVASLAGSDAAAHGVVCKGNGVGGALGARDESAHAAIVDEAAGNRERAPYGLLERLEVRRRVAPQRGGFEARAQLSACSSSSSTRSSLPCDPRCERMRSSSSPLGPENEASFALRRSSHARPAATACLQNAPSSPSGQVHDQSSPPLPDRKTTRYSSPPSTRALTASRA
jgi:hypothetical protein